jgi:hypothetical protein
MTPLDLTEKRFGRLVALRRAASQGRRTVWLFLCDCGNKIEKQIDPVVAGRVNSCGCKKREVTRDRSLKHGHSVGRKSSPELRARDHAKGRCYNVNDPKYPLYGGRGIRMCEEWRDDFNAFFRDMGPRPKGTTLDRINVDGHYEPGNCRWATPSEQAQNRRLTLYVDWEGRKLPLVEFARDKGLSYKALHRRLRDGQSLEEAIVALSK